MAASAVTATAAASAPATMPTPLSPEQAGLLARLTDGLDGAGLWWLSGYAAGLARAPRAAASGPAVPAPTAAAQAQPQPATVLYGSQTGNAKRIAEKLATRLEHEGLPVRLLRADAYSTRELRQERHLYLVISTQGDGEPPDDARGLVEFIAGRRAPKLPELRFAVLGLGDSSYPQFCEIGRRLDTRLAELGATRLFARGDADLDIDSVSAPWLDDASQAARSQFDHDGRRATVTALRPLSAAPAFDRDAPFSAELLANQRITGHGSDRDIRHIELSLEGSGLEYQPGDALGIWPRNPPALVDAVIAALRLSGDEPVEQAGQTLPLRDWLGDKRELTRLSRPFLGRHADRAGSDVLARLLEDGNAAALSDLLARQQPIDLLLQHPADWRGTELVAGLRPLIPRLYSIASSQKVVGDEAHLTVAHIEYQADGATRWGAASHLLASTAEGGHLPVFIEHNERFRLPADPARDIVMIGPGTGVAPFRGFVQERAAIGASGRNWLLFGNPHFCSDFLYQLEWQRALRDGQLHRLDLAFSRDQAGKTYVQHRLREHGRELYAWMESGAHLYVCGDATRMARDVHETLIEVVAEHGGHSRERAEEYVGELQQAGRYARDVY